MVDGEKALEIATQEMARHGRASAEYTVTLDPESEAGGFWLVWFDTKSPYPFPGGRDGVRVNKQTGEAEFLPGE